MRVAALVGIAHMLQQCSCQLKVEVASKVHDYSTTAETFHESIVRERGVFNQSKVPEELLSCMSGVWFIVTTNPSPRAFAGFRVEPTVAG